MESISYLIAVTLVMAVATFLTRVLPFALLYKVADHPLLGYLGRYLPPVLMVLLVLYTFKNEDFSGSGFLPELLALACVSLLHLSFRSPLLSILGGTGCYMYMVQAGVPGL
ncbi:branched-chain amino acid transporter permease [Marinobacterium jannaschii]|uniref:branched-chain amino acid transporter permease n=1 Tax=Marinobacterium jannaschii TaxID=64970 RepID=UPI000562DE2A|nr:AzlD domain-containing protein [Marinobacterium jannaschii]